MSFDVWSLYTLYSIEKVGEKTFHVFMKSKMESSDWQRHSDNPGHIQETMLN